jgi:hypothetical protein
MKPRMSYDYTLQKNVRGKPWITVSAKGISNGLSDIPNDGADFGPDTPGTQTSGLAEAVYYQANIEPKKILLGTGTFILQAQVPIYDSTVIEGTIAPGSTYEPANSSLVLVVDLGNNPVMPFKSSSLNAITLKNLIFDGHSQYASSIIDFSVFPEHSHPNILENIIIYNTTNFNYDFILDNMEDTICNHVGTFGKIQWQASAGSSYYLNGVVGQFIAGSENTVISNTTIKDSIVLLGDNTFYPNLVLNNVWFDTPSKSLFYVGTTNTWNIGCYGCTLFTNQNQGSPSPVFALQSGVSSGTIYATFNNTIISEFNQAGTGCSAIVPYPMFDTGITGKAILYNTMHNCGGVPTFWTDWQNWLVDYFPKNVNAFSINTPAVPASGTAITNNNPFSVDIYITNAGSVSSYQINSLTIPAGLSVGQKITLAPGWSLTLTYTTAPTWTWAYHV